MGSRVKALTLAGVLVGWSRTARLEIPARRHPLVQAGLAAGLVAITGAPLGLRPPALRSGLRLGTAAAAVAAAGVAASTALPQVRAAMAERDLPAPAATWLGVQIPLGTVWSEEAAYRAALGTVAAEAFGRSTGRLVQATAFGLSHVNDARATGEPVAATVVATGIAGWLFGSMFERSRSLAAPMLAHLVINEAAAIAALAVHRRNSISARAGTGHGRHRRRGTGGGRHRRPG
ncbi:CPBP family intramembrane glutamic endopeptidase [Mycobacterium sp.]|uniref:Rv0804 family intramembrane glutamic endopeptidase n=1 Tax=Mycobacterium sp. TaxID=1785 RepID=UPI002D48F227|nr:CPBP family intramembrane glutamic endopeptidase [Mycobacterium sp.]HZA10365.1 CPBP family intramembrane glutamic endopeptidase [Mycobacterium sp.]